MIQKAMTRDRETRISQCDNVGDGGGRKEGRRMDTQFFMHLTDISEKSDFGDAKPIGSVVRISQHNICGVFRSFCAD